MKPRVKQGERPMRSRGLKRVQDILDATEILLAEKSNEDVSLAQIAEQAEIPLASLYHFFPNRNAAFVALAKRFNEQLYRLAIEPMDPRPTSWQQVVSFRQARSAAFLNARPAALRLFLGAGVSVDVRAADWAGNEAVARSRVKLLEAYFHLPYIKDLQTKIAVAIALQDGIWALSYGRLGFIAPEFVDASTEAAISYLRNYLPQHFEPRMPDPEALAAIDVLAQPAPAT
ncbi:TetR/AcrR family transcriptional regulator [Mesorhizobium sp. PUT5]|uniref:TetR/AcrR family transcriptional regulator n=1 Tax=Mesorhizobium sp. PUT5 TaxID=3454629 RepID=UPI003FA4A748